MSCLEMMVQYPLMPVIRLQMKIDASTEVCFDAARSIDVHQAAALRSRERAVGGVTVGLIGPGESVTWEAVHFGVKQRLTSRVTEFNRPHHFVDSMVRGAFHSFSHVHEFTSIDQGTMMVDVFYYKSPLGPLGRLADRLFLEQYMRRFLQARALYLKKVAESVEPALRGTTGSGTSW